MPEHETDILIVGAGPAGLMAACRLVNQNIRFRIIDKSAGTVPYSGAMILHAGSLELFSQLGIADDFVARGSIIGAINMVFDGKLSRRIEVGRFGNKLSLFPYALILEQSVTQNIMSRFLEANGCIIERGTELKDVNLNRDHILASLERNSVPETLSPKYLIAADGGKSLIRSKLGIQMNGKTNAKTLFTFDCNSNITLGRDEVMFSFSKKATAGFFPLPNGRWRIDGAFAFSENSNDITATRIADSFSSMTGLNLNISHVEWFSLFYSHQRNASSFNQGGCFLIGDAAHIYSPVGAQGMNHGLQDASNLAWKLSLVIRNQAKPFILDSYQTERKSVSENTAQVSDTIFQFLSGNRGFIRYVRVKLFPYIIKFLAPALQRTLVKQFLFRKISGIGVVYHHGMVNGIISYCPPSLKAGKRLPNASYLVNGTNHNLLSDIGNAVFTLLIFERQAGSMLIQQAISAYHDLVVTRIFRLDSGTQQLFRTLGIHKTLYVLVRPDFYIGFSGYDPALLKRYLDEFLLRAQDVQGS